MKPVNRKVTYRMYPITKQAQALTHLLVLHQRLYNAALNAQSAQVTLRRVALAFDAFFRRVKQGDQSPGYPRFKSLKRFSGWGYKTHGDGWRLLPGERMQH